MWWKTAMIYLDGRRRGFDGVIILEEGDGAGAL
jgi:hypothetical protein